MTRKSVEFCLICSNLFLFDNSIDYHFMKIFRHEGLILQSFSAILRPETDRPSQIADALLTLPRNSCLSS